MSDENLDRAIGLSRSGKKMEAREILNTVLRANLQNETAWLWFADTFPDNQNRILVIEECLKHNPNCQVAHKWLVTFRAEEEAKKASTAQQILPDFQDNQSEQSGEDAGEQAETSVLKNFDLEIDCSDLDCPLPIMRTKRALDSLETGQVLKMIATDPSSIADIEAWTDMTGHKLIEHVKDGEKFVFYIEHK